jgi:protein-disulfide isomerase
MLVALSHSAEVSMSSQNSGAQTVVAALILGVCVIAGAMLIRGSVDQAAREVASLREALGGGGRGLAAAAPSPSAAQPGRPDPNRRYSVNTQGSPVKGNEKAKLAVVEFSDFQCPYCRRVGPTLEQIQREYGDQVRIVFKHLPLPMHQNAPDAHAAAEAAHQQGKFWEMHDLIFADQQSMSPAKYQEYARQLGLDMARFERDVASEEVKQRIAADAAEAARLGVSGTPAFYVNGRFVNGAQPYEVFKQLIDQELGKS